MVVVTVGKTNLYPVILQFCLHKVSKYIEFENIKNSCRNRFL